MAIGDLEVGDEVLARDEANGTTDTYPVTAIWSHPDAITGTVVIDGEPIAVTPEHPFRTTDRGWVTADDLEPGDHIVSLARAAGLVGAITWDRGPDTMWNLTVATAHTYTVGDGGWLVHNTCPPQLPTELTKGHNAQTGVDVYRGVDSTGSPIYAGISNDVERRAAQHGSRFAALDVVTGSSVTRGEARAIEQALIVRGGSGYQNKINSISPKHGYFSQAVAWGETWLRANGVP